MLRRKSLIAALVLLALSFPLGAVAGLPQVQKGAAAGLPFWLIHQPQLPIIQMQIVFRGAGYSSDPEGQQGRAALAVSLLTEGAGEKDSAAFTKALEANAIELSAQLGRDHMTVNLKTLSSNREKAFALLADMLRFAHFDEAAIAKRKRQMQIQRMRQQESPAYAAQRAYVDAAYGDHPYAQEELGSDASVQALSAEDLRAYYQRYVAKDAAVISLAGDVEPLEAQKLLSAYLGELRPNAKPERIIEPPAEKAPFELSVEKALPQSLVFFARPSLAREDADFYGAYVLNYILGGGALSSQLAGELREKRGLTYGVSTGLESGRYANRWIGSFATQNATADEAVAATRGVLTQMSEQGVSEQALRAAKDYLIGSFPLQLDGNGALVSYLTIMQLYDLGSDYLEKRNALFEAVSLEQINRLAQQYLSPAQWSWVMVKGKETP